MMIKLLQILSLFACIAFACSDCIYSVDAERKPTFIKKFGSRKKLFKWNKDFQFHMKTGETIEAFCANGFWHGCSNFIPSSFIELKCNENGNIYYSDGVNFNSYLYRDCGSILKCTDPTGTQLYESKKKLTNCEPNMSLGVGMAVKNYVPIILAGICYDWNNMDLKYVNYMAYKPKADFLTLMTQFPATKQIDSVTLDDKLDNVQDLFSSSSDNDWFLNQYNFENASLVQELQLRDELKSFENLLQIIWWRDLRMANWRSFLELLSERSRNVTYNVYTGTSGTITMPTLNSECSKTLSYTNADNQKKAVPAYIWSYLKSSHSNILEELVVIGYNSPYYYDDPSIYLCEDICDEFEWFRPFHKLRKMATLGLIYCCRPEDVAHKLNNFPLFLETESELVTTPTDLASNWNMHEEELDTRDQNADNYGVDDVDNIDDDVDDDVDDIYD